MLSTRAVSSSRTGPASTVRTEALMATEPEAAAPPGLPPEMPSGVSGFWRRADQPHPLRRPQTCTRAWIWASAGPWEGSMPRPERAPGQTTSPAGKDVGRARWQSQAGSGRPTKFRIQRGSPQIARRVPLLPCCPIHAVALRGARWVIRTWLGLSPSAAWTVAPVGAGESGCLRSAPSPLSRKTSLITIWFSGLNALALIHGQDQATSNGVVA